MDKAGTSTLIIRARPSAGKIEELESLRGLAALLVVFFHFPKWTSWLDIGIVNNGYLMVELFFVLSGFVIYNAYGSQIKTLKDLSRFQFLRFGRLYPVHLLFLLAFLAIECAKVFVRARVSLTDPPFGENSLPAFVQQVFLVQALGPTGNEYTFNAPAWSISAEFYTYLIFGAVVLLTGRLKLPSFAAIAACAFLLLFVWRAPGFELILNCLTGFFIGCLVCHWLAKSQFVLPSIVLPLVAFTLIVYLSIKQPQAHDWMIFVFSPLLIIALLRSNENCITRVMRTPVLVWLGSLSYAIYMSHSLIISLIIMGMKRGLRLPELISANGSPVAQVPAWGALLSVVVSILAVLTVSQVVFKFLEVPLRDQSRKLASRHSFEQRTDQKSVKYYAQDSLAAKPEDGGYGDG